MKTQKGRGYVYAIQYHIVWCTKYRKNVVHGQIEHAFKNFLSEQTHNLGIEIINMQTDLDHVHLLISASPQHYIPSIIKSLKGNSARYLFKEYPNLKKQLWGGHLWNPSYFISTVSEQTEEQIKTYIQEQQIKKRERGRPIVN